DKKIEFRHLSFENPQALWSELKNRAPLYVSCSAAYYEFPSGRPMQKKNWLGADLIFDLDAEADELSPFITQKSLDSIKQKAIALIENFLIPDFGFSKSELHVNFSGSRGYHVRAYKKEAQKLGRQERREVVDYIEGLGLDFQSFFSEEPISGTRFTRLIGPSPNMGGYKGKFARRIIKMAQDPKTAVLISPKLKKPQNSQNFIAGVERGIYSNVQIPHALEQFRSIFEQMKLRLTNQVETDANVTVDTSKILRLPDSIHGGSGLIAKSISNSPSLSDFDPLKDALAFKSSKPEKIKTLSEIPQQEFAGQTFEKIEKEKEIELPEGYAMYLVCKRKAIPI
ncbi:MAG: DNA primase catalytic subunit PriS, partial [Candidatus Micrarchaeota archaeon]